MRAGARFRVSLPSLIQHLGFTVFALLAYIYIGGQQRFPRGPRDQTDRETTVRRTLAVVPIHSEVNRLRKRFLRIVNTTTR